MFPREAVDLPDPLDDTVVIPDLLFVTFEAKLLELTDTAMLVFTWDAAAVVYDTVALVLVVVVWVMRADRFSVGNSCRAAPFFPPVIPPKALQTTLTGTMLVAVVVMEVL